MWFVLDIVQVMCCTVRPFLQLCIFPSSILHSEIILSVTSLPTFFFLFLCVKVRLVLLSFFYVFVCLFISECSTLIVDLLIDVVIYSNPNTYTNINRE